MEILHYITLFYTYYIDEANYINFVIEANYINFIMFILTTYFTLLYKHSVLWPELMKQTYVCGLCGEKKKLNMAVDSGKMCNINMKFEFLCLLLCCYLKLLLKLCYFYDFDNVKIANLNFQELLYTSF